MSSDLTPETVGNTFANAVERVSPGVVTVYGRERLPATGTVLFRDDSTTTVITASHVIEREENISVILGDETSYPATLMGRDLNRDLAVLQIESGDIEPVTVDEAEPRVGTLVMAVGRPFVRSLQVSLGAVSVFGSFRIGSKKTRQLIHAETTLYPGFSGGPLIDAAGAVIGINTSGEMQSGSYTIPAAQVMRVAKDILEIGYVRMPWVGITVQQIDLPPHISESLSGQTRGLVVLGVEEGAPSSEAGLLAGDILVAVEDQPLEDVTDLQQPLCDELIGESLTITGWRGDTRHDFVITPTARPEQPCT
jgi:S1-C subfamily serine protease